ncbi:SprT family protein [Virgibacillus siamensis]|uniref:SprT family protein n=1 Tax=Virgibacillus siamensis TaxID=480071 RepID=UPI000985CA2A|nr:SprT family protein [Virgibacillus siamensis]
MKLLEEQELHQLVHAISIAFFNKPYNDKVTYNHRLRTTGGRYIPAKRLIELNPKYAVEMGEEEVEGIIKHELCHYHLHIEGKGYKHGDPEFKSLLKKTGSPRHCKPLPSTEKNRKYIYKCEKCAQTYKRVRRIDVKKYRCGRCHGRLRMKE